MYSVLGVVAVNQSVSRNQFFHHNESDKLKVELWSRKKKLLLGFLKSAERSDAFLMFNMTQRELRRHTSAQLFNKRYDASGTDRPAGLNCKRLHPVHHHVHAV